jgi:hypothetical protein
VIGWFRSVGWGRAIEAAFLLAILISVVETIRYFLALGLLPQPYFIDANDTFMDWFNVAVWSHNPGAYDQYLSVYPPFVFVFMKLMTPWSCNIYDKLYSRECDQAFPWEMGFFFIINAIFVYKSYLKNNRSTAWIRAGALIFGLPMLFGVERGQLAIPTFTVFVLGHGNLLKLARWKWLNIALAVNSKIYLILTLIPQFLRRRWVALEGCAIAISAIYLVSFCLEGEGSLQQIIRNITGFNDLSVIVQFQNAFYEPSYTGVVTALKSQFPFMFYLGSEPVDSMLFWFPAVTVAGQIGVFACFVMAAFRPFAAPVRRLTALSILLVITSSLAGGYTLIFVFFLVLFEPWRGPARITALVCVYLLSVSTDFPLVAIGHGEEQSYLSNRFVSWNVGVNLGELVRPGLVLLIEYALIAQTVWDVWKARKRTVPVAFGALPQPA